VKRGISINSSTLCVGGCGNQETEDHLFLRCPTMGAIWSEIVRWIGVSVALAGEGPAHLTIFKNIVPGNVKSRDRIGVIWFTIVSLIWKEMR
jgi:hypothetical protein